jgi:hypothetical protein
VTTTPLTPRPPSLNASAAGASSRRFRAMSPVIRRSWALWAAPVLLGLIFFYAGHAQPADEGYWVAATSAGTLFLSFIAPACAACAAWEGYRARRLIKAVGSPARSPVRIMAGACWPIGVLAVTAISSVLWIHAPAPGTPGGPDLRILGVQMLLLTAHTEAPQV